MGKLPTIELPKATVTIGGQEVTVRGLSRAEALKLTTFKDDAESAETFIVCAGAGVTEDEANEWRANIDATSAGILVDKIIELSGLIGEDPKKRFETAFMKDELDAFNFALAEKLHMTVGELNERMSSLEYVQWQAYYVYKDAMLEMELKKQQGKAKPRARKR